MYFSREISKNFICMLFVVLVFLVISSYASAGIRVDPPVQLFVLDVGERATGTIVVTNTSDRELNFFAVLYDWAFDEDYELDYMEGGTLKETLEGLIRFNPRQFDLGPGESQIVRFTVTAPEEEADNGFERRGIIFFEHEDAPGEGEVGATVKYMVGATIYVQPPVYEFAFSYIEGLVHVPAPGQYWGAILVRNDCQVHIKYQINYKVLDKQRRIIEEGKGPENVVLPGNVRGIFFPLKGNYPPGEYELMVEIGFPAIRDKMIELISFKVE